MPENHPLALSKTKSAFSFVDNSIIHFFAFVLVIFFRRPDQFTKPYLWNEDGTQIIPNIESLGASALMETVNGYIILSSTLINFLSVKISFEHYPQISSFLSVMLTFILIKRASNLFDRTLGFYLFLLVFLMTPTDSEVLGVGLYTFWILGLFAICVFFVLLHEPETRLTGIDVILLVLAMLSGPFSAIAFSFWLLLGFRSFDYKKWIIALILSIACGIQLFSFLSVEQNSSPSSIFPILASPENILLTFFANFFANDVSYLHAVVAFFLIMMTGTKNSSVKLNAYLISLLFISMFLAVYRTGVHESLDPFWAGPRYFFYPYAIILLWVFSSFWLEPGPTWARRLRVVFVVLFFVSLLVRFPDLQRTHEYVSWSSELENCVTAEDRNPILVFYTGYLDTPWALDLSPEQCRSLIESSLFHRIRG